jgi:ethanolamine utilization microcompartment shell protein EutS
MRAQIRKASLILVCLTMLTQVSAVPSRARVLSQQSAHLYQVSTRDEKSGEKKIGFIDQSGKLVIGFDRLPRNTKAVGEFHEGRAVIYLEKEDGAPTSNMDYKAGYIDVTGKVIIAPRFDSACDFSEGLACVEREELRGFINRDGEVVIKLEAEVMIGSNWYGTGFHEGLAVVSIKREMGFIDRSGKLVIKGYTSAASFSEGLAAVAIGLRQRAKYGFVNEKGEMVIAPRFDPILSHHNQIEYLSRFSEGLASVKVGDLYGYINQKGDFVIPPRFHYAADFSEGLANVMTENGEAGYIDRSGRLVIAPRLNYYKGGNFKEGLAPFAFETKSGTKWGYIDRTGRVIIEPRFDVAYEFVDGVASVYELRNPNSPQESRFGYIDKTGKYLWEPQ